MRYLVFSDVHGNLDALTAVLDAAGAVDAYLVLGDLVGYGAQPNEVIDCVRRLGPLTIVRGNHDKVACGLQLPETFNPAALEAAAWTYEILSEPNRQWLREIPAGPIAIDTDVEICHGSPDDEDEYLFSLFDAERVLPSSTRKVCFFGHTHFSVVFSMCAGPGHVDGMSMREPDAGAKLTRLLIDPGRRYLINPGAVGQPRDGDPRAAFAIWNTTTHTVELHRVAYPVARAQARIRDAGLPEVLARRLSLGR